MEKASKILLLSVGEKFALRRCQPSQVSSYSVTARMKEREKERKKEERKKEREDKKERERRHRNRENENKKFFVIFAQIIFSKNIFSSKNL